MAVVLDYQPGRAIPQVEMDIRCEGEGQPMDNFVAVQLRGVREPASFRLMCNYNTTTTGYSTFSLCYSLPPRGADIMLA